MKNLPTNDFIGILQAAGYKATSGRIALLKILKIAKAPLSVPQILEKLGGGLNQTTIYRALESLTQSAIVRRIDLEQSRSHYELITNGKHHHHIICRNCEKIEDVDNCSIVDIESIILKKSKSFSAIIDHSLEFFGTCNKCAS